MLNKQLANDRCSRTKVCAVNFYVFGQIHGRVVIYSAGYECGRSGSKSHTVKFSFSQQVVYTVEEQREWGQIFKPSDTLLCCYANTTYANQKWPVDHLWSFQRNINFTKPLSETSSSSSSTTGGIEIHTVVCYCVTMLLHIYVIVCQVTCKSFNLLHEYFW